MKTITTIHQCLDDKQSVLEHVETLPWVVQKHWQKDLPPAWLPLPSGTQGSPAPLPSTVPGDQLCIHTARRTRLPSVHGTTTPGEAPLGYSPAAGGLLSPCGGGRGVTSPGLCILPLPCSQDSRSSGASTPASHHPDGATMWVPLPHSLMGNKPGGLPAKEAIQESAHREPSRYYSVLVMVTKTTSQEGKTRWPWG